MALPERQKKQRPQLGTKERMTRSPGFTEVTPSPTSTTVPAPSWPRTTGNLAVAVTVHYVKVAAADAGGAYFDVDFTRLWRVQFDFFYGQGLSYFPENGSFHVSLLGQRDGTDSTRVLRILPG